MNPDTKKTKKNSIREIMKMSKSLDLYALATVICFALAIGLFLQKDLIAGLGWLVASLVSAMSAYREITLKRWSY
ncbi:hypothetical protein [Methanolobus chelungpuianus]|uniref:Uncharacterized protein n=1 Tax=Methanolobus chelungpuianus TaxID=502115 RepID=A0AAE3HBV8_9EURY|nr:hypothetical protein [Methanolobus chelungpuianus]MCQ6963400.1 hypothetical protein [Methanolobus chelungpuianus]